MSLNFEVSKYSMNYFRERFLTREIRKIKDPRNISAMLECNNDTLWYIKLILVEKEIKNSITDV